MNDAERARPTAGIAEQARLTADVAELARLAENADLAPARLADIFTTIAADNRDIGELARLTADIAELAENADLAPARLADIFATIAAESRDIAKLARLTVDNVELARLAEVARLTADIAENVNNLTAGLCAIERFGATVAVIADLAPAQLADIFTSIAVDNVHAVTTELVRQLANVDNAELVNILAEIENVDAIARDLAAILDDPNLKADSFGKAAVEVSIEDMRAALHQTLADGDKWASPAELTDTDLVRLRDADKHDLVHLLVQVIAVGSPVVSATDRRAIDAEAVRSRLLSHIDNDDLVLLLARRLAKPRDTVRWRFRRRAQERLVETRGRLRAKERQRSLAADSVHRNLQRQYSSGHSTQHPASNGITDTDTADQG